MEIIYFVMHHFIKQEKKKDSYISLSHTYVDLFVLITMRSDLLLKITGGSV